MGLSAIFWHDNASGWVLRRCVRALVGVQAPSDQIGELPPRLGPRAHAFPLQLEHLGLERPYFASGTDPADDDTRDKRHGTDHADPDPPTSLAHAPSVRSSTAPSPWSNQSCKITRAAS